MVKLPASVRMGAVRLRVQDLDTVTSFYRDTLGLREERNASDSAVLSAADGATLLRLERDPDAVRRPARSTGLYHFALLFPDRPSLGAVIRDVASADHAFHGFADHLVSEAAYLADPEDNGIELYRDRPRSEWQWHESTVRMSTDLLDVPALLAEAELTPAPPGRSSLLRMGHVHLHVASIRRATDFYTDVIGFDITNAEYPGATFLSAGGYHHHLGVNEWSGGVAPPAHATGLIDFEIIVPDAEAVAAIGSRAPAVERSATGLRLEDPDGHGVVIRTDG